MYLENFNVHSRFLDYDAANGRAVEVERMAVPESERDNKAGCYVNVGDRVAGFYRSKAGPVFFVDSERIPLGSADRGEVRKGEREYEFVLLAGGEPRLSLRYKPPFMHFDNWSDDEEMVDLFQWFSKYLPTPGFHRNYTSS